MNNEPEQKAVLKCSQKEFTERFIALLDNQQLDIDTVANVMQAIIKRFDLVDLDKYRKQRHLSEDAVFDRIEKGSTMYFMFNTNN
jgi:hypothetical protein